MKDKEVSKVIVYLNCLHSLEGGDNSDNPIIQEAMSYCAKRIESIAKIDPFSIPGHMLKAIEYLKNHTPCNKK
jgi:hypothetical protein